MSEAASQAQPVTQAGLPGEATRIGVEVGVLRSSQETPVTGAERRRDTCPDVRSDRGRRPRKGIRLYDAHVINPDFSTGSKPRGRTGLGKPDTGNPSVRFDEGSESDGHWPTPFIPSAPAYSTTELWSSLASATITMPLLTELKNPGLSLVHVE